jgi:ubiquinone/menaquinone biosynthesis C-methylase UbiE
LANEKGVADKVLFHVMDYTQTNFADESFDVVWACESMSSASDKKAFIAEAYRLLKKGGRLIVIDFFVIYLLSSFSSRASALNKDWIILHKYIKVQKNYIMHLCWVQFLLSYTTCSIREYLSILKTITSAVIINTRL